MAKKVTERKPLFGNNRSHALNATRKKQGLNLQVVDIDGKKVKVSAREIKTMTKQNEVK
jgi:large subunit ribosomal protein L28